LPNETTSSPLLTNAKMADPKADYTPGNIPISETWIFLFRKCP
jgi:hypothetical protein